MRPWEAAALGGLHYCSSWKHSELGHTVKKRRLWKRSKSKQDLPALPRRLLHILHRICITTFMPRGRERTTTVNGGEAREEGRKAAGRPRGTKMLQSVGYALEKILLRCSWKSETSRAFSVTHASRDGFDPLLR